MSWRVAGREELMMTTLTTFSPTPGNPTICRRCNLDHASHHPAGTDYCPYPHVWPTAENCQYWITEAEGETPYHTFWEGEERQPPAAPTGYRFVQTGGEYFAVIPTSER